MLHCASLIVALAMSAVATQTTVGKTYAIKLKKSASGDSIQSDVQASDLFRIKLTDASGKIVQNDETKSSERFVFRELVLEAKPEDKKATRLEREYERVEIKARGETRTFPYVGKPLLIEKKGNRYEIQVKGGKALTFKEADFLFREFNQTGDDKIEDEYFLPKMPIALGETWKIETDRIVKSFQSGSPLECDAANASAVGKLLKVYTSSGRQFGVLAIQVSMPLRSASFGKDRIPFEKGARTLLTVTLDVCIDGTMESGEMSTQLDSSARGTFTGPDKKSYKMEISAQSDSKEVRRDVTRK